MSSFVAARGWTYTVEPIKDEIMYSIGETLGEGFVDGIKSGRVITWQDGFSSEYIVRLGR